MERGGMERGKGEGEWRGGRERGKGEGEERRDTFHSCHRQIWQLF